jgi:hypothetical protein
LWAIRDMRRLLNPFRFGLFSLQFWSHKVLRYLAFFFLPLAYGANLALLGKDDFYTFAFVFQNIVYAGTILSILLEKSGRRLTVLYPLHYFVLLNLAAGHAFAKFLLGRKQVFWMPRKG